MKKNRTKLIWILAFALVFGDISFGIGNIVYAKEEVKAEEKLKGDELEKNESEQEESLVNKLEEKLKAISILDEEKKIEKLEDFIVELEESKDDLKDEDLNSLKDLIAEEIEKLENGDKKKELLKELEELIKEEVVDESNKEEIDEKGTENNFNIEVKEDSKLRNSEEIDKNLPEYSDIEITSSKKVPRIGEKIKFSINGLSRESLTDIRENYIAVKNFEKIENIDALRFESMKIPDIKLEYYNNGQWINNGITRILKIESDKTGYSEVKKINTTQDEKSEMTVSRKDIEDELKKSGDDYNNLKDDGETTDWGNFYANRIVYDGPIEFNYEVVDKHTVKNYATFQGGTIGYKNYDQVNIPLPINWLYYETSDIKLELAEENRQFKPGETIKLKAIVKNTSENIPNQRLYPVFDFGEKEIVKNPKYTEGNPNGYLEDFITKERMIPGVLNPKETIEFYTSIEIPKNITKDMLNDKGQLVITPALFTSNIKQTSSGNVGEFNENEREYNEPLLIDIEKQEHNVSFETNGGSSVESQTVKDKEKAEKPVNSTKDGYEFVGWYENEDLTGSEFDFNTEITSDKTLYAKWEKESSGGNGGGHRPKPNKDKDKEVIRPQIENTIYHKAYIKGYEDNTVRPQGNLTREEAAMIIYRILDVESSNTKNYYSDIENTRWSKEAINYLSSKGIIEGYPEGDFRPEEKITRAEVTALITRLEKKTNKSDNKFSDINNHWAKDYILISVANNWVVGYPEGDFRPNNNITRAEFVTMINRMLGRKVDEEHILNDIKKFKDLNKSEWYYTDIVEASNSHNLKEKRLENGSEDWTEITK